MNHFIPTMNPTKAEGGENMQSATERRQLVLEYISDQRKVSMEDIMHEFDISRPTAKRDVQLPLAYLQKRKNRKTASSGRSSTTSN